MHRAAAFFLRLFKDDIVTIANDIKFSYSLRSGAPPVSKAFPFLYFQRRCSSLLLAERKPVQIGTQPFPPVHVSLPFFSRPPRTILPYAVKCSFFHDHTGDSFSHPPASYSFAAIFRCDYNVAGSTLQDPVLVVEIMFFRLPVLARLS